MIHPSGKKSLANKKYMRLFHHIKGKDDKNCLIDRKAIYFADTLLRVTLYCIRFNKNLHKNQ